MKLSSSSIVRRNPTFRRFLLAVGISLLGTSIFDFAIPLYVIERTNSVIALSLANVALHLPFFLMAPITGFSADNFNKRKVMLGSDAGQVILLMVLLSYTFLPADYSLIPILIAVFIAKTFMILFETVATFQLIPSLVDKEDLHDANTWFLSVQRFIQILAPVIGGVIMSVFGFRYCVLANILSFAATLYFIFKMKNLNELLETDHEMKAPKKKMTVGAVVDSFIDSIRYVWKSKMFRALIFMLFIWNASPIIPGTPAMTYYFTEVQNYTPAQYGSIVSFFGFISIFGFLGASNLYKRFRFHTAFAGSGFLLAVMSTVALLFYQYPILFAIGIGCSRAGASILSLGTFVLRQTNIPRNKMGGINACLRMFFMSSTPVSALIQGPLLKHTGILPTFIIGALCLWGTLFYSIKVSEEYELLQNSKDKKAA